MQTVGELCICREMGGAHTFGGFVVVVVVIFEVFLMLLENQ